MKNFNLFYIPITLTSFFFIHITNLIKGNVFELDIHSIEKLSILTNFFLFFVFMFIIFFFLSKQKTLKSKVIKLFLYFSFFLFLFSSQIYGVYTLPVKINFIGYVPRSIIVLSIFSIFLLFLYFLMKFSSSSFMATIERVIKIVFPISFLVIYNILSIPIPKKNAAKKITNNIGENYDRGPIIYLLFDMMPMDRFDNELINGNLPNFKKFKNKSTYFKNAFAPGSHTVTSASSIFYGNLLTEIDRKNLLELKYRILGSDSWFSSSKSKSIFSDALEQGLKTNIIATANMSYSKWFGEYINAGYYFLIAPPIDSFKNFILYPYVGIYNYLVPKFIKHRLKPRKVVRMEGIMNALPPTIENISQGKSDLLFVHFPIPHHDFVYNRDGTYDLEYSNLEDDFTKQLYYTDTVFGEIMEILIEKNIYDKSTIIVFSDHGWSDDPVHYTKNNEQSFFETEFEDETFLVRVPLLIKLPYQDNSVNIIDNYSLLDLRNFNKKIINKGFDDKKMLNYINEYSLKTDSIAFTRHQYHNDSWELLKEKVIKIKQ